MIILIRHAQSSTNARGLLVGHGDPHLSELGERQARALTPYLAGVEELWVSPLARARETAALALGALEATVRETFIEVDYGTMDGQPLSAISARTWRAFEHDHDVALGGGESLASVDRRVHGELEALLVDDSSLLHDPRRHLAIVTHLSPIKSALVWALGVSASTAWRTRLDNGSITTLGVREALPQLVRFNVVPVS